jgi:hypothetical protein
MTRCDRRARCGTSRRDRTNRHGRQSRRGTRQGHLTGGLRRLPEIRHRCTGNRPGPQDGHSLADPIHRSYGQRRHPGAHARPCRHLATRRRLRSLEPDLLVVLLLVLRFWSRSLDQAGGTGGCAPTRSATVCWSTTARERIHPPPASPVTEDRVVNASARAPVRCSGPVLAPVPSHTRHKQKGRYPASAG